MSIKHKRFISSFFLLFFISISVLNALPFARVSAAPGDMDPRKEAQVYQAYKFLTRCSETDGYANDRSSGDLNQGNFYNNSTFGGVNDNSYEVGFSFRRDDGLFFCVNKGHVRLAMDTLGLTGRDFLVDAGIYKAKSGGDGYELTGVDYTQKMKDYLKDKFPDASFGDKASKAAQYFNLKATFERMCIASRKNGIIEVKMVDGSGNIPSPVDKFELNRTDVSRSVGFGMDADGGNDGRMECDTIVSQMNKYADEASAALKKAIDNGEAKPEVSPIEEATGSGSDGQAESEEAQCLAQGSTIGWVLCPIYNLVADSTRFFYEQFLQPLLKTPQVDIRPGGENDFYQAWSTFRFYGNMFLVIAMIVIVFGQSIGGGLIDAYTAKKVMPRIIAAAIMINLSIYIIAIMVDITNIIGIGIASLIMAPFGSLSFTIGTTEAVTAVAGGVLGALLTGGTLWGFISAAATGGGSQIAIFIALTMIVPALLAVLAVVITLIIRRGLIWLLILISPVALALYVLPNTEKYFKKWWDLLFKALLVYPIIMAIQAVANVMSVMVLAVNNPGNTGAASGSVGAVNVGLGGLIAFFMQLIPLFLIPFAFKMAGGAIGGLYAAIQGGSQKAGGLLKNRQEVARKDANSLALQARQRSYNRLGQFGDRNRALRPFARFAQSRVGGYDMYAALAADTAARFKEAEAIKDTGIDDELRGLTVNKQWALERDRAALAAGVDGNHVRVRDGARQFRTLGGRWVNETDVDNAHQRWGGNMPMMQWAIGYEMQKAATQEEMDYLYGNYGRLNEAGSGLNLTDGQMGGMWTGAAFAKQNTDRQYKHYAWRDGGLQMNGVAMMREIDERQGNWAMMSQSADTWTSMSEEVNRARSVLNGTATPDEAGGMSQDDAREVLQRGARIARSLSGGSFRDPETGRLVEGGLGQGASGRTKEEIENYAALFDPGKGGSPDYKREVGVVRRGSGRRSGDTYTEPTVRIPAGTTTAGPERMANVDPITGDVSYAPTTVPHPQAGQLSRDPSVTESTAARTNPRRNPPRGAGPLGRG